MVTKEDKSKKHWLESWHVNPSVNKDYDFIDGLRGMAILMVVACHLMYDNPKSNSVIQFFAAFVRAGQGGVVLFFALSGFLISWPFWKRKFAQSGQLVPPGYGWRRFWKIYTPLALSIVVFTPIYIALNHDWSYCAIATQWVAGIPFLLPVSGKFNPVMWTLVIEVQFYILLPFIFISLKRISPKICLWIITLLFLLVPFSVRIITGWSATYYPDINPHFPSALDSFALGILVAGLDNSVKSGALKKSWAHLGIVGLALWPSAMLVSAWVYTHPDQKSFATTESIGWMEKIAAGCLLCFIANPQHPIARLLCAPWLRWCGIISYEWYLFHQPIINWSLPIFGPTHGSLCKFGVFACSSVLAGLIFSALIYRYFSLPILKRGRAAAGKN
jgi:peptidoglycan/LPS O-acetylase OafA/YrhL